MFASLTLAKLLLRACSALREVREVARRDAVNTSLWARAPRSLRRDAAARRAPHPEPDASVMVAAEPDAGSRTRGEFE